MATIAVGSSLSAAPASPTRARSVSQPIREGVVADFSRHASESTQTFLKPSRSGFLRSQSSNAVVRSVPPVITPTVQATSPQSGANNLRGRARSSSLMAVREVGGDEPETVVDRSGVGTNHNAAWVNAPGSWLIHPVMILLTKVLVDAIPGMTQDVSWTVVNIGYIAVSFLMFHHVTGVPFESTMTSGGAYDDLTLWEQIDSGAQYTPAKKWLTSVPIVLFLISTHYTRYDYILFALNFAALVFVLFPKLPILHRLRIHFLPPVPGAEGGTTPYASRPPSPHLGSLQKSPNID